MAEDIQRLAELVYQRARQVETAFARFRARDFPTDDFELLAIFPQSASAQVRKAVPGRLQQAAQPNVDPASVARMLSRYGRALDFIHRSLEYLVNAEVVSIPAPFVLLLHELGSAFLEPRFVLQGAPLFTYSFSSVGLYLNRPLVAARLRGRHTLPNNFAVFRFPAALREDGLGHALLGHELGHYVDSVESLYLQAWSEAGPTLQQKIERFIKTQMGTVRRGVAPDIERQLWLVYTSWVIEMVCDIFAARVLGPAYLFSSLEFLKFQHDLTRPTETHPPSATRLWVVTRELRSLGWAEHMERALQPQIGEPPSWSASQVRALSQTERPFRVLERCLLEYSQWEDGARTAFAHCVPPGELPGRGPVPPRAILNAGWFFHLAGCPGWAEPRGDKLRASYEKRCLLSRLVLKGLEISYVVGHWGRAVRSGGRP
jgi:hypothetical protein